TDEEGVVHLSFTELYEAAYLPKSRDFLEGKTVRISGQFVPQSSQEFTLSKTKMTCCYADQVILRVRMELLPPASLTERKDLKIGMCVSVKGKIHFKKEGSRGEYAATLQVKSSQDIQPSEGCE